VLITRGDRQGTINEITPRMHAQLRAMERECSEHNLRLHTYTYDYEGSWLYPTDRWRELVDSDASQSAVIGFIVWPIGLDRSKLHDLVLRLMSMEKPISVPDDGAGFGSLPLPGRRSPLKLYSMAADPAAARAVGRFLLGLGHRKAAFISPFQDAHWARTRLRGLLQAFRVAGFDDGVKVVVTGRQPNLDEHGGRSVQQVLDQLQRSAATLDTDTAGTLNRAIHRLRYRIVSAVQEQVARESMVELFDRAPSEAPDVTAWVGCNDYVAVEALEYLRGTGRRVPEDISVMGFDDGLEAHLHKLTSYNFNGQAIVRSMLGHILDPERLPPHERSVEPVATEGFVVVRETTGRVSPER